MTKTLSNLKRPLYIWCKLGRILAIDSLYTNKNGSWHQDQSLFLRELLYNPWEKYLMQDLNFTRQSDSLDQTQLTYSTTRFTTMQYDILFCLVRIQPFAWVKKETNKTSLINQFWISNFSGIEWFLRKYMIKFKLGNLDQIEFRE